MHKLLLVMVMLAWPGHLLAQAHIVWWEGEDTYQTNFPKQNWWSPNTFPDKAHLLFNKNWLVNGGKRGAEEAFAKYKVEVPAKGHYRVWARKFWKHGPFRWHFDKQPWRQVTRDVNLLDSMELKQHTCVNWVYLGRVTLAKGEHMFELRLLAGQGEELTACFDAFFITNDDTVVPAGINRPEIRTGKPAADEWFPVAFYEDEFEKESVIDISHLVEAPAGKYGFLKQKNGQLKFEKAKKPIKFWGCGANFLDTTKAEMTTRCRYLRKHGINMVRQHPLQSELGLLKSDGTLDPVKLDKWDWWFAELKKHGIYMTWSLFYPHHITPEENYDLFHELPGPAWWCKDRGARSTSGLVNIEPDLQASEWRWAKAVLTHKNKYTGKRYVDDPALAVVEVHNEDSVFWHAPLNDLAEGKKIPEHTMRLQKRWGKWVKKKYGSDSKLKAAWGAGILPGDSVGNASMKIYGAWEMEGDGPKFNKQTGKRRIGDFILFLSEMQKGYYEQRIRDYRDIGFKGITITTAWRAGGPAADAANLWCDTAGDMVSRHNYFGGGDGGHDIKPGKVNNGSHLSVPGGGIISVGLNQAAGRAFCMTEWTQKPPNLWKLEIAPIVAFYGMGLQDWDASYHFLNSRSHIGNGWPGQNSYVTDTPHFIGQFPALAIAVYRDHIKTKDLGIMRVSEADVFGGSNPLPFDLTKGGHDDKSLKEKLGGAVLAVGRVSVAFGKGGSAPVPDPNIAAARYWDKSKQTITSMTGELVWDYGQERILVKTGKTQGVVGKPGEKEIRLPGVTLTVNSPFVSLLFTPLDDQDLDKSRHILITAMGRDMQTGTEYNEDGTQLVKMGNPPLLMEPVQADIKFKKRVKHITVLDVYGVPTRTKVKLQRDGSFHIDGTYATYYYEVKR